MRLVLLPLCVVAVIAVAACAGPERKAAVPPQLTTQAVIPGMEGVRYRVGIDTDALAKDAVESFYREVEYFKAVGREETVPPATFLALSGGGDNGAFGAGVLNGWTEAGNRPTFKLVTGVSTGALIAPFAFLGPDYDQTLKHFYTESSPEDILELRGILAPLTSDALADNTPLRQLLQRVVTQDMLDAIAEEHHKGRVLLVATTDLDARQGVLWNLTKIAASGDPKALDLFHSIMIASTSIPGVFPPIMIDVEAGGRAHQEMHVDGGTMSQLFIYPPQLHVSEISEQHHVTRERRAYIIRNARLDPDWASVDRRAIDIAGRAISSLIHTQGIGDLFRVYLEAKRDNVDFNLAYIPASFNAPHREDFDTEYMRALFQIGYEMAVKGYRWEKAPPGF